ncbi:MAG: hypothetical protein FWE35_11000 [Streptosporangiales bacterium]|nr:hypothetical protein [Streptosporangiales bacterium]
MAESEGHSSKPDPDSFPEFRLLGEAVRELARRVGKAVGDLSSEHERWWVYQRAVDSPQTWNVLLTAVSLEENPAVAGSVVSLLLEKMPASTRMTAVQALPPENRDFAAARARDLAVLDALADGSYRHAEGAGVDSWSTWLQLRGLERTGDERLLAELASQGRTKRVRGRAAHRLRLMKKGSSGR